MNALYSVVQTDDSLGKQEIINWLKVANRLPSANFEPGRLPAPAEIRAVLDSMEQWRVEYLIDDNSWEVEIWAADRARLSLGCLDYAGDETRPAHIFLQGNLDLMQKLLAGLASLCGPFILTASGELDDLIFITPDHIR